MQKEDCPLPSSKITLDALPETQPGRLMTSLIAALMSGDVLNVLCVSPADQVVLCAPTERLEMFVLVAAKAAELSAASQQTAVPERVVVEFGQ